jgi:CheY-like chemotaxis protein
MQDSLLAPYLCLLKASLVVEDDPIIRLDIQDTLRSLGVQEVRGASTLNTASEMAESTEIGFAILDYELGRDNSLPVAEKLMAKGIPVLFLTAYGKEVGLPPQLSHLTVLAKPFTSRLLVEAVLQSLQVAGLLKQENESDVAISSFARQAVV